MSKLKTTSAQALRKLLPLGSGYTKATLIGVSWVGLLRFLTKSIAFIKMLLVARLLAPEQFGAYGIALLVLGLLEVITETGLHVVLVQEQNINRYINSAWLLSIIRGLIISLIIALTAPYIASFFNSSSSIVLLYLISVASLLRGFVNPAIIQFQKELQFSKDFLFRFPSVITDASVSIATCYILRSPIGIVLGLLSGIMVEVILSFIATPRPKFRLERHFLTTVFHRGKWVTASSICSYLFHNADNIVVGRMLGESSLGVYQVAYSLSIVPLTEVADVFFRVIFPVFTKISYDKCRLLTAFIKMMSVVSLLTIPYGFLLFFFPHTIVPLILGDQWVGAIDILPILALFGAITAISSTSSALFWAVGKQEYVTVVTVIRAIALIIIIIPLVSQYRLIGAAVSAFVASIIVLPIIAYYTRGVLRCSDTNATPTRKTLPEFTDISR